MATQYTELVYRSDPTTGKGQQVYNLTSGKSYSSPTQLAGDLGIQPSAIDWSKIGKSSAGDLASGQQQVQTGVSPVEPGGVSSIDAMLAGYQEQFKQATEAMKTSSENVANAPQFSATDFLNQQMQSSGINEALQKSNTLIAEANVIRENIAKLEDQKNQEILSMRERGGVSQVTLNARENIAEMKWNSRISAESAKLSGYAATIDALNGNITRAQSFITQAVNAATYDQEQNLNRLTQTYEMNKDLFSALGSQYQNAFNQAINIRQTELANARAEKTAILNLQVDAADKYGVSLDLSNMTLEQATDAYTRATAGLQEKSRTGTTAGMSEIMADVNSQIYNALSSDYAESYNTREELIDYLANTNVGVTRQQVADAVYSIITDQREADIRGYELSSGSVDTQPKSQSSPVAVTKKTKRQEAADLFKNPKLPEGLTFKEKWFESY